MKYNISMIVAMSSNRCIGKDNQLLWNLPEDMKWFKNQTTGKTVVMGHETFNSIGRLLPGRSNVILSRNKELVIPGALVLNTVEQALALSKEVGDMMIIGGGEIYRLFLPYTNVLMITEVDAEIDGDTYFPELEEGEFDTFAVSKYEKDEKHFADMTFNILLRNKGKEHDYETTIE
ncbi:putative dihydrofolate reductase [Vibrio phage phiKT1028]|nr:putative dihydrofolate reductase [Vibrio phage phiKT1028]